MSSPTPSGGGGGSVSTPPPSPSGGVVVISGRAYPFSKVMILQDGQLIATTIADQGANFNVSVSGLSTGNYIFSVYGRDSSGNRSSTLSFPTYVTTGITVQIGSVFIAPTISLNKIEVRRGDLVEIFGQSIPSDTIDIHVHSTNELFLKTQSDSNGVYLYNLDSSQLESGQHVAMSMAMLGNNSSLLSNTIAFEVGTKNVFANPSGCNLRADVNGDCRVNLVDFSILAYWQGKSNPPANVLLDGTSRVDFRDFSIMAYNWTG